MKAWKKRTGIFIVVLFCFLDSSSVIWPNASMRKFPTIYHANSENLWNWLCRSNTQKKLLNFFCCVWSCGQFFWPGCDVGFHFKIIFYLVLKTKQEHEQIYPHLPCLLHPVCCVKDPVPELSASHVSFSAQLLCLSEELTESSGFMSIISWFAKMWVFPKEQAPLRYLLLSLDVVMVSMSRFSLFSPVF